MLRSRTLPRRRRRKARLWKKYLGKRELVVAVGGLVLVWMVWLWTEKPPARPDDICAIFSEKRSWYGSAQRSYERWGVPEAVLMAVIHQESSFRARARPPRRRILWIIPWRRPTTAYGYAQALDATWQEFRVNAGRPQAERYRFDDAAHFVGWYGTEIERLADVPRTDAYRLYLAYHEGPGGYRRGSHLEKAWLLRVARKVEARAGRYQAQLDGCRERLDRAWPWRWVLLALVLLIAGAGWRLRRRRTSRR